MPLSENEMKQIEQDARKYVADSWNVSEEVINLECTHVILRYEGYIAGSTAQAEKYQSEVESLRKIQDQLLSKIRQLEHIVEFGYSEGTPDQHNAARIEILKDENAVLQMQNRTLRQELSDIENDRSGKNQDINYDFHEGRGGEHNELL